MIACASAAMARPLDSCRNVEHAEFQRAERGVRRTSTRSSCVVDAIQLYEEVHEIFVRTPRFELFRHTVRGTGETPWCGKTSILCFFHPKGRTGRKGQKVR